MLSNLAFSESIQYLPPGCGTTGISKAILTILMKPCTITPQASLGMEKLLLECGNTGLQSTTQDSLQKLSLPYVQDSLLMSVHFLP